jgi:hypothetical protein
MVAALYDHGVVFGKTDLDRFVKTQLEVCWNGSLDHPVFLNTEGKPSSDPEGKVIMAEALARFAPQVREYCYGPRAAAGRLRNLRSDWSGGAMAVDYLAGKYLRTRTPEPQRARFRDEFCKKPENAALLKELEFEIGTAEPAHGK